MVGLKELTEPSGEDFYASNKFIPGGIGEVRRQLESAQLKYNSYRPHQRLGGLTLLEYVSNLKEAPPVARYE
jgi:transposase InsO family protein